MMIAGETNQLNKHTHTGRAPVNADEPGDNEVVTCFLLETDLGPNMLLILLFGLERTMKGLGFILFIMSKTEISHLLRPPSSFTLRLDLVHIQFTPISTTIRLGRAVKMCPPVKTKCWNCSKHKWLETILPAMSGGCELARFEGSKIHVRFSKCIQNEQCAHG